MVSQNLISKLLIDIAKGVKLNLKTLWNNWKVSILVFLIILSGPTLSVIYIPYIFSGGWIILSAVAIPLLILLGFVTYNFRNSTIYLIYTSFGGHKITFYISQIIVFAILGNLFMLTSSFIIFIFGKFGILIKDWAYKETSGSLKLSPSQTIYTWQTFLFQTYLANLEILVSFGVYYLVHSFIKNIKSYYLIVVSIMVLSIIFGGSVNDFFWKASAESDSIPLDSVAFPDSVFWFVIPTMPFYGVGQMFTTAVTNVWDPATKIVSNIAIQKLFFNWGFTKKLLPWTLVSIQPYFWILISFAIGTITSHIFGKRN